MYIRLTLNSVFAFLAVVILGLSAMQVARGWSSYGTAMDVSAQERVLGRLVEAQIKLAKQAVSGTVLMAAPMPATEDEVAAYASLSADIEEMLRTFPLIGENAEAQERFQSDVTQWQEFTAAIKAEMVRPAMLRKYALSGAARSNIRRISAALGLREDRLSASLARQSSRLAPYRELISLNGAALDAIATESALISELLAARRYMGPRDIEMAARTKAAYAAALARFDVIMPEILGDITLSEQLGAFRDGYLAARDQVVRVGIDGGAYPLTGAQWASHVVSGLDIVGAIDNKILAALTSEARNLRTEGAIRIAAAVALLLVVAGLTVYSFIIVSRAVTRPITEITEAMGSIAEGDFFIFVPHVDKKNEIGIMARALEGFKVQLEEQDTIRAEQEAMKERAYQEKIQTTMRVVNKVEEHAQSAVEEIASACSGMTEQTLHMRDAAKTVQTNSDTVTAAAEQTVANMRTVSESTSQVAESIDDITVQVANAAKSTQSAVGAGRNAEQKINSLSQAVATIGQVANMISEIAAQTNLLALNATIEAARAGDAGKGFAVVANEVKALASQTANSTEEINRQIREIQLSTDGAVDAVNDMARQVDQISQITNLVTDAVTRQNEATQSIVTTIRETQQAAEDVARNIVKVSGDAAQSGEVAAALNETVERIVGQVNGLRQNLVKLVSDSMDGADWRQSVRYIVNLPGSVIIRGQPQNCLVTNMSTSGARLINLAQDIDTATGGTIAISGLDFSLPFLIAHREDGELRVAFDNPNAFERQQIKALLDEQGEAA